MNRILEVDAANLRAVVQPGVVNLDLSRAVENLGLYYAPDPSSQRACTIGGNVSENSGGPHTLAYGVTSNHVTGMELVLPDGEIVRIGGKTIETPGYDLDGCWLAPKERLRWSQNYGAAHAKTGSGEDAACGIRHARRYNRNGCGHHGARDYTRRVRNARRIYAGRRGRLCPRGLSPRIAPRCLLIELEGLTEAVESQAAAITEGLPAASSPRSARRARRSRARASVEGTEKTLSALSGRLSPTYYVQDGVIPRTRLPETLRCIEEVSRKYDLRIGNIFHAGDGNLHPLIFSMNAIASNSSAWSRRVSKL